MTSVLLADIGGSTTRFAVSAPGGRPQEIGIIDNDSVSGAEAAIRRSLDETGARPDMAVLAVAGPIDGDEIRLTNRSWRFRLTQVRSRFGFSSVHALNDFEAVAHALAGLRPSDLKVLGRAAEARRGPKVVLGPGTGLGVAALLPNGKERIAVASEAGHVSFGPACAEERAIFARLEGGADLITAETVISGPGLERIYGAANPGHVPLEAKAIVAEAGAGDPAARTAVRCFVRLLGRFAGDMALAFKATGGVYLAGGVARKLGPLLDEVLFRTAFENHPPYQRLLATIPTSLVTCLEPGLIGCAALAEQVMGREQDRETLRAG